MLGTAFMETKGVVQNFEISSMCSTIKEGIKNTQKRKLKDNLICSLLCNSVNFPSNLKT